MNNNMNNENRIPENTSHGDGFANAGKHTGYTQYNYNAQYGGDAGTDYMRSQASANGGYNQSYSADNTENVSYTASGFGGYSGGYDINNARKQAYGDYSSGGSYNYGSDSMGSGYGGYYSSGNGSSGVISKKDKSTSKGFVIGFCAIVLVISIIINLFVVIVGINYINSSKKNTSGGNVQINKVESSNTEVVTDKGLVSYVASVAQDTVVEITTETVSTNVFYGQYVTQGAGSGVIVSSKDGETHIITCAHVIQGATKVTVTLRTGEKFDAVSTSYDSISDIGFIKLSVDNLKTATIGDYSKVIVGEQVVAIGNPLGSLGGSVASGYVSALDRDIIIDGTTYNLLQTDTAINPGNSGGGLFNSNGELIGIVNAKSSGENIEGLGFAIPIDDATDIFTDLVKNGYVSGRPQLGFNLYDVSSSELAYYFWAQYRVRVSEYGVYIVSSIDSNFKLGDRLVAIDDIAVSSISDVKSLLTDYNVGDTVTVTVSRQNSGGKLQIMNFDLTLTESKNQ